VARVDGVLIAEADERRHPAGSVVALAADGAVTVSKTSVQPCAHEPPVSDGLREASIAGASWMAIGLLLALVVGLVLRRPWTSAPAIAGWALAAPAFALATGHGAPLPVGAWTLGVAGGVAVLIVASLLHGRLPFGVLLPPAGAALIMSGMLAVAGRPAPPPELVGLPVDGFDLPRLSAGLAHMQHPGLRRLNSYLVDHSFRGRRFALRKPKGTLRVACLGTSTTWGYGLDEAQQTDFPSMLQALLNQQPGGQRVEVINAGVRGWTAPRMRRLFEEVVAEFEPDVVTLSLYYNDAIHATVEDEEAWLTLRTQPEFESDWTDCFRGIVELRTGTRRLAHLQERLRIDRVDSRTAWLALDLPRAEPTPPERFERSLRQLAAAVRSTGASLVLAKEPVSGRSPSPWREEIYAVIDQVGAEAEVPVVELAAALQAGGGAALYMDDIHLLPNGNRIVASQLAPVIQELLAQKSRGETGGAAGEPLRVSRFR
jgi:lysophospholipase L1-like esterase